MSFTTTQFIAMQLRCDAGKKKRLNVAPEPKTHDIKPDTWLAVMVGECDDRAALVRFATWLVRVPKHAPLVAMRAEEAEWLKQAGLSKSTSEASRLVTQGGVKVDQQRVEDPGLVLKAGASYLIQVGKRRIARITLVGT